MSISAFGSFAGGGSSGSITAQKIKLTQGTIIEGDSNGVGAEITTPGGMWKLHETITPSGATSVDFSSLPEKKLWRIIFKLVAVSEDFIIGLRFNDNADSNSYRHNYITSGTSAGGQNIYIIVGSADVNEEMIGDLMVNGNSGSAGRFVCSNSDFGGASTAYNDGIVFLGGDWIGATPETVITKLSLMRATGTGTITGTASLYYHEAFA